jgi:neurotransmitter:Na+ symporter, NSS family
LRRYRVVKEDLVSSVPASARWSSPLAAYLGAAGAAVGLGSIWRFPYLAGTGGGSAFILVFVLACVLIATPLLVAEFALGRASHRSPPEAAGVIAAASGLSTRWNIIGILGSISAILLFSYYTVIAGWVLAYTWKCAVGSVSRAGAHGVDALWHAFLANPWELMGWHAAFVFLVATISARGIRGGIEPANRFRGPALLIILLILSVYSLSVGQVRQGLTFAFWPDLHSLNAQIVLAAIGQAFYATGVGQAMMIAYGSYLDAGTSLVRTALTISASILIVSILATVMIFPLVFAYHLNTAQGPELVFNVLPRVFAEMPGGRLIGSLFFFLLVLAALMPSIALLEPSVAWLAQSRKLSRARAAACVAAFAWLLGMGSVLSFNRLSGWYPLGTVPIFRHKTFFDVMDYTCSNLLMPSGAMLTSLFVGWRVSALLKERELRDVSPAVRAVCVSLLRYVCPIAIGAVFAVSLL